MTRRTTPLQAAMRIATGLLATRGTPNIAAATTTGSSAK